MYKCIKCGKEFEKDWRKESTIKKYKYATPRFCSLICGHMRIVSNEQKRKISEKLKGRKKNRNYSWQTKEAMEHHRIVMQKAVLKVKETWEKKILEADFNTLGYDSRCKRIKNEQNNKCNKCGLSEWQGQKLVLEIEHRDGNHQNNSRENLEALCPNCHSLTHTWRGKNKKGSFKKFTETQIIEIFKKEGTMRKTLIFMKLAASGDNYSRLRKILEKNNIDLLTKNALVP